MHNAILNVDIRTSQSQLVFENEIQTTNEPNIGQQQTSSKLETHSTWNEAMQNSIIQIQKSKTVALLRFQVPFPNLEITYITKKGIYITCTSSSLREQ